MRLFRPLGLSIVTLATVLLAACGSTESGTATTPEENPAGTDTTQTSTGNSPSLAPPVPEPLDPEMLLSEPCDLLDEAQLDQLGLVEYSSQVDDLGYHECIWATSENGSEVISVSAMGDNENGLDDIYAQREQYKYFQPATINGYPAVFAANYSTPDDGRCGLYAGVTDELAAFIFTQFPVSSDDDPCPITQEVAESVIDTLKG